MKKLLLVLTCVGSLLVAAAYWVSPSSPSGNDIGIVFAAVELGTMTDVVSATGPLSPLETYPVSSLLSGPVVKIFPNADFNRRVEENEPLLQLDSVLAEIKLEQAKVAVELAKADVTRAKAQRDAAQTSRNWQQKLLTDGVGQQSKLDEASHLLEAAEANVEAASLVVEKARKAVDEARIGLDKSIVRAPAAGIIISRDVSLGQMVGPQSPTPLFKIASDLAQMQVNAQVAEGDVGKIRKGLDATFTLFGNPDDSLRFEGKVKQIRPMPISVQGVVYYNTIISTVNRRVPEAKSWTTAASAFDAALQGPLASLHWLRFQPEEHWMLHPGMTATVEIIRRKHDNVWKMPTEALNFQLEDAYQTHEARAKIAEWHQRADRDDWKHVWVKGPRGKPWPIFVRIGGVDRQGDSGIKDTRFNEVLEWEQEVADKLNLLDPSTFPQVIISAPPVNKPGIFEKPTRIMS